MRMPVLSSRKPRKFLSETKVITRPRLSGSHLFKMGLCGSANCLTALNDSTTNPWQEMLHI